MDTTKERYKEYLIKNKERRKYLDFGSKEIKEEYHLLPFSTMIKVNKDYVVEINLQDKPYIESTSQGEYYFIDNVKLINGFEDIEIEGNERLQFAKGTLKALDKIATKYKTGILKLKIRRTTTMKTEIKVLDYKLDLLIHK